MHKVLTSNDLPYRSSSTPNDMTEIKRCTTGMCLCILQVKVPEEPAAGKNKIAKV
jgi:hypothetical protein